MKTKRAIYNLLVGVCSKIVLAVLSFIIPKLFIENYGSDINGLLSSVGQVFAYLGLLEAGVGAATTQALYKVVSADDWDGVSSILNAASEFYRKTGLFYLIGVIITSLVYIVFVETPLLPYEVFFVILFSGLGNVVNYLFQSKYIALLNTEGKTYIHVGINTVISIITQLVKIVMIRNNLNIVLIYAVYLLITVTQVITINVYMHLNYKCKLNKKIAPNKNALSQHSAVLVHQISALIFTNTDILLITFFRGLKEVSIYSIYNMVMTYLNTITVTVLDSFVSALGLLYNENRKRFNAFYDVYEFGSWIIYYSLMSITLFLYEPFISMYMANADISYLDAYLPLLFVVNQLLSYIRMPGLKVMNIAGCFQDTKSRTIIESSINLALSVILLQICGIYGVLLGTTVALLYRTIDIIIYSNQKLLNRNWFLILRRLIANSAMFVIIFFLLKDYNVSVNSAIDFILLGVKITAFVFTIYIAINGLLEACFFVLRKQSVFESIMSVRKRG